LSHGHVFDCHLVWVGAEKGPVTDYASYSRELTVEVEGKSPLRASAAPVFRGDRSLWNPEDLLVASLSTCHCLSYLAVCARAGIAILAYEDRAHGKMEHKDGAIRFVDVLLRPRVTLATGADRAKAFALHVEAHHGCFIANSVNFPVRTEPEIA
jgi:organic hydroperoxide reductase OsmC/OhrA